MNAFLPRLSLLVLLAACSSSEPLPGPTPLEPVPEPLHVIVLHTNDIHGQVLPRPASWLGRKEGPRAGGLPRVAAYIEQVRRETAGSESELLVLDAGDWSQGTPEGQIEQGKAFVRALRRIRYDAMCLGNHEFDHGLQPLKDLLTQIELPVVTANLVDPQTGAPVEWIPPTLQLEVGGMQVMVVGLLSMETPKITHEDARSDVRFRDPSDVLQELQTLSEDEIDWWLPLTHLGHEADLELARRSGVPLVVGGHSHRFLGRGIRTGNSLVVQAGCKATVVGRVDLWFDAETHEVLRSEAQLVDLLEEPAEEFRDAELDADCEVLVATVAERMDEVLGTLEGNLTRSHDPLRSSPAGNLVAGVTRGAVGAEVGIMNRGGIRTDPPAGEVTRRALFELCPFDNNVVSLQMTGAELFEFLQRSIADPEHSGVEVSGVTLGVNENRKLLNLMVGEEPCVPDRVYQVAMNSFMATGGDGYLDLEAAKHMSPTEDPRTLRLLLEEHFLEVGSVTPDLTNHYELAQ